MGRVSKECNICEVDLVNTMKEADHRLSTEATGERIRCRFCTCYFHTCTQTLCAMASRTS